MPHRGNGSMVDPDDLRKLAKEASARHLGGAVPLTEAVVQVVQEHNELGPEHVRRIVEFANNATFQMMFEKGAEDHRVVNFTGGPADPGDVLKELDMGATHTPVAMSDRRDTITPYVPGEDSAGDPFEPVKTASEYPAANPMGDFWDTRDKLRGAKDHFEAELVGARQEYDYVVSDLVKEAKQAAMSGYSTVDMARALSEYSPHPDFATLALNHIQANLDVADLNRYSDEVTKTAGAVNPNAGIVVVFRKFVKLAQERFTLSAAVDRLDAQLTRVNDTIKRQIG